jgi:hypothetical protein
MRTLLYARPKPETHPKQALAEALTKAVRHVDTDNALTLHSDEFQYWAMQDQWEWEWEWETQREPAIPTDVAWHLTWRSPKDNVKGNNNYDSSTQHVPGYVREWENFPHGVSIATRGTSDDSLSTITQLAQLVVGLHDGSVLDPVKYVDQWRWKWNNGNVTLLEGLLPRVSNLFTDHDTLPVLNDNITAMEIISDSTSMRVYTYYLSTNEMSISNLGSHHDFAIVTEMEPIDALSAYDHDRFVQGYRSDNGKLIPTMFVFSPPESSIGEWSYTLEAHQADATDDNDAALHPKLEFSFTSSTDDGTNFDKWSFTPQDNAITDVSECRLHAQISLSRDYILDKYEIHRLITSAPVSGTCISQINALSNNGMDLELPSYRVSEYGSEIDITLDPQCIIRNGGKFSVPTHLRYHQPTQVGGLIDLPKPDTNVYWECPITDETSSAIAQSFYTDTGRLGFRTGSRSGSGSSSVRQYFYSEDENECHGAAGFDLAVPAARMGDAASVNAVTLLLVVLGAVYVFGRAVSRRARAA